MKKMLMQLFLVTLLLFTLSYVYGVKYDSVTMTLSNETYRDYLIVGNNGAIGSGDGGVGETVYGGAISIKKSDLIFNGEIIFSNNALHAGSGGNAGSEKGSMGGSGGNGYGGALYVDNSSINFNGRNITFVNNLVTGGSAGRGQEIPGKPNGVAGSGYGGVIYAKNNTKINLTGWNAIFSKNSADYGGAIYITEGSQVEVNSETSEFSENRASDGGAIYIANNSEIILTDSFIHNNTASNNGGAVYLLGNDTNTTAKLIINAVNKDVMFTDNKVGELSNDIHLQQYGEVIFNANQGKKIKIQSGITGTSSGNIIKKIGDGILEIGGTTNFSGNFIIERGSVLTTTGSIIIWKLEIDKAGLYGSKDKNLKHITYVDSANIDGTLQFSINFITGETDQIIGKNNSIVLGQTSKIAFNSYGIGMILSVSLIEGYKEGDFEGTTTKNVEYSVKKDGNKLIFAIKKWSDFEYIKGASNNQKAIGGLLDNISYEYENMSRAMHDMISSIFNMPSDLLKQEALDQMSGSFIADALKLGANNNNAQGVYARLKLNRDDNMLPTVWSQINFAGKKFSSDENTLGDFKNDGIGVLFGADFFERESFLLGAYLGYNSNDLKQGKNSGTMKNYEIGLYGIKTFYAKRNINLRSNLAFGMQEYQLQRDINFLDYSYKAKSDFDTKSLKLGIEIEQVYEMNSFALKPFLGLHGGYIMNKTIKEEEGDISNLSINAGNNLRLTGIAGLGIDRDSDSISWNSRIYIGSTLVGTKGEIEVKLLDSTIEKQVKIEGSQEKLFLGVGLGVEFNLSKRVSISINGSADFGSNLFGYYGSGAINYKFGANIAKNDTGEIEQNIKNQFKKAKSFAYKHEYLRATDVLLDIIEKQPDFKEAANLYNQIVDNMNTIALDQKKLNFEQFFYAKGYIAYYQHDYVNALIEWEKSIQFTGDTKEIREYLDKINGNIKIEKSKKQKIDIELRANQMFAGGVKNFDKKEWVKCIKAMESLQKFLNDNHFPKTSHYYSDAKHYIDNSVLALNDKLDDNDTKEKIQDNANNEQAMEKYNEGLALFAQGNYLEAQRAWELTLRLDPNHQKAKVALENLKKSGNFVD